MGGEERTKQVFGDYVSVYNFKESTDDKNTVPLYYENRIPELQLVNESLAEDIADIVGASRPVVSSILSGLRKRGLLNYTRDMICVNDSALSLMAESLDTGPKGVSSI